MPRLNIEDEWFDDPRREALIGVLGLAADGVAIRMWRLAQTYYRAGVLVPVDLFERVPHWREFEGAGLAERREDGVYVKGQRDRFAWLKAKSEAGAVGGKSPKKTHAAPGKQTEAKRSKTKQTEASSSASSSPSSSASSSASTSVSEIMKSSDGLAPAPAAPIWESYREAYRGRYGVDPVRNATVNSQLKAFGARVPAGEGGEIAAFYVRHNDSFYVRQMHPVGLLLKDAEKLRSEWFTGRRVTGGVAREVERRQDIVDVWAPVIARAEESEHGKR